ncbi:hypothetical protein AMTRI_Chr12g271200 [Amborella trichopoda]
MDCSLNERLGTSFEVSNLRYLMPANLRTRLYPSTFYACNLSPRKTLFPRPRKYPLSLLPKEHSASPHPYHASLSHSRSHTATAPDPSLSISLCCTISKELMGRFALQHQINDSRRQRGSASEEIVLKRGRFGPRLLTLEHQGKCQNCCIQINKYKCVFKFQFME